MATFGFVAPPAPAAGPLAIDAQEGVVLRNRSSVNLWPDPHALAPEYVQGQYVTYANDNPTGIGRSWCVTVNSVTAQTTWTALMDLRGLGAQFASQSVAFSCWLKAGSKYGIYDPAIEVMARIRNAAQQVIGSTFDIAAPPAGQPKSWTKYSVSRTTSYFFASGVNSWADVAYLEIGFRVATGSYFIAELEIIAQINAGDRVIWRALPGGGLMTDDTMPNKTRDVIALQRALLV